MKKLPKPKYKLGYNSDEIKSICKALKIKEKTFWSAFGQGNTCGLIKGKTIYYVCDVERALFHLGDWLGINHMWD